MYNFTLFSSKVNNKPSVYVTVQEFTKICPSQLLFYHSTFFPWKMRMG